MIKNTLIALALVVTPTVGISGPVEDCVKVGERILRPMAEARDLGMSANEALQISLTGGLYPQLALESVKYVFISARDATPQELTEAFIEECIDMAEE